MSPSLALPVARARGHGVVFTRRTDVVVEGYPRSGNTFAVAAFAHAQHGHVDIAHHTHAPAHVIAAARAGIPALVLIREPEGACVDFVSGKPYLSLRQALRGYVRFYRPLLRHRPAFVVGTFDEVHADFGAVMTRLNARFGTSFVPFEHTEENVRATVESADRGWAERAGPGLPLVGRGGGGDPAALDPGLRERLVRRYRAPSLAAARRAAEAVYTSVTGQSPHASTS
jgi:hypothetical protein